MSLGFNAESVRQVRARFANAFSVDVPSFSATQGCANPGLEFANSVGVQSHSRTLLEFNLIRELCWSSISFANSVGVQPRDVPFGRVQDISVRALWASRRNFAAELGLAPVVHPLFAGQFSPRAVLALFSNVLAKAQPDYHPNTVITRFPFYDRKDEQPTARELVQFLENGEPPILFTLDSAAVRLGDDFFRTSIEVARRPKRRALPLVGDHSNVRGDIANKRGRWDQPRLRHHRRCA